MIINKICFYYQFILLSLVIIKHNAYQCMNKNNNNINQPLSNQQRKLYVAVCDTRSGWKEFQALKVWNITGEVLRKKEGIHMKNVCKGMNWGKQGFLTKPLIYLNYIKSLIALENSEVIHSKYYIILMDSDTFWSVNNIDKIWKAYDCARNNKNVVVSTEMSCWIGRYCQKSDLDRWYWDPSIVPSYSPFVNSGVVMGTLQDVSNMLEYVVTNNQSYITTYGKRKGFDDQYAIADYAIKIAPELVQLDYHQLISASASIHAPGDPPDQGWPFVCKNRNGTYSMSCHIYTNLLRKQGHFVLDQSTCLVHRSITNTNIVLYDEMKTIALDPLIWHGNGAGKQIYMHYGYQSFKCYLTKYNLTEQQHQQTFG